MEEAIKDIRQKDGYLTRLFYYETTKAPVLGTILLLHGMAEHYKRYLPFIQRLNQEGFDVFIYNHRGHGTDKKLSDLGYFAEKNGASLVVSDAIRVCEYIKSQSRSNNFAIFGHSMGSMILRCMIQQYHELSCAVVSSTTVPSVAISNFGLFLSSLICLFCGKKTPSPFLKNLLFGGPLYRNLCTRTAYDWLTTDKSLVEKYINDPYCGFVCTASFYHDLIKLAKCSTQKHNIKRTKKELPVFFLTGSKDPIGDYGKSVAKLKKTHECLGFSNTSFKIYEEARHELLNEFCAEEVMQDIISFFHKHFI